MGIYERTELKIKAGKIDSDLAELKLWAGRKVPPIAYLILKSLQIK